MAPPLPLIFLLMIAAGVYSDDDWGVSYSSKYICALKGSSVIMSCTYKYPPGYKILKVFWTKTDVRNEYNEFPDLNTDPEYSQRIQYLGDKQQNCTIRLNDVTQKDSHKYYFRFITDKPDGRWIGKPGVTLDITDLHVESPESVTEGDTVSLTCKSTCNLSDRTTFIWWKNTQSLTERNNKLLLQSVRREDAGRYSCAVHGHNLTSPHVYLNVKYSPKNVSVSMSGSGEIVLGDSVNLTCSSDSNPPVLNYTWFKENESSSVGSGQSYSALQSGFFYCVAQNQHGSQRSAAVSVTVRYRSGWHVVLGIMMGCGGLFIIIIIIILFKMKKRAGVKNENLSGNQDQIYCDVIERVSVHDAPLSESETSDQNDSQYASIKPKRLRGNLTAGKAPEYTAEIEYATVQHHKHKEKKRTEEHETQNDRRSDMQTVEEDSVIYSSHDEANKLKRVSSKERLAEELDFGEPFTPLGLSSGTSVNSPALKKSKADVSLHELQENIITALNKRTDSPEEIIKTNSNTTEELESSLLFVNAEIVELRSVKGVDTSMLRRAIWNYIHCMFGIHYDDYDYGEINQLLDRGFKVYIKTMVCSTEKITKRMYESFWRQFQHSEKVHVNLLLMDASMQAELLYALRAITTLHDMNMAPPLPLIFLLMIAAGVYSDDDWGVSYSSKYICALKGSSVIMSCTYKYPPGYKIEKVFWTKTIEKDVEPQDLFNDPEYSQRIQYLGDKQQNCTIRLNDVTQKDSLEYYFRFITDKPDGRWTGYPGVTLNITDLHVESPESVTEGDTVSLTCKSTCNLTDRTTFIWRKNTQSLTERNNKLLLQSVRREDAGRYSCAVHGHKLTSPHVDLNVKYPPEIPVIFISTSGEIVLGDSVTLTCSSDSNPPAQISWFKGLTYIGSGEIYSITSIRSDHSGEYKCKSRNEVGEKYSDTVTLNVMYSPRNVSVSMSGSGEIVLGDSVTLTCSSDSNPPVLIYTWFKENESSSVGSGQSYSALQSGFFYCVTQNQHGSQRSAAVSVTVGYRSSWYIMLGVMMGCGGTIIIIFIIFIILFIIKRERMNRRSAIKENETADRCDDTYTTLDLKTRSSDDVYNTITPNRKMMQ
ncbi:B-cell receptor CD22-like [Xyrauchen texanus]|uniref:B-cell receptor CD22-like n=1 Tax=Xyrauchen texanus TaxID=154827 RepID=UPI002242B201|nr:B-cell receptor CD22-like [Xyrauchen texanus]